MASELLPIAGGFLLGSILGFIRPELRQRVVFVVALLVGLTATLVSGEYRISWSFLAVDMSLVLIGTAVAFQAVRRVRLAAR